MTNQTITTDKYKKLTTNTLIMGVGSFSSKLLVFFLGAFYTRVLTTSQLGTADLIVLTANLLFPIVSLGVSNAALRFALDKDWDKKKVFSTCISLCIIGYLLSFILFPLVNLYSVHFAPGITNYIYLIYIFILTSSLRNILSNFTRGLEKVKLYAIDGVICTAVTIALTLLFLYFFKFGVEGYCLAIILADSFSILFLFLVGKLHRFLSLRLKSFDFKPILKYSIPLVPTMIFWWITTVSDRYIVTAMIGSAANGLYAISQKLPTIIVVISGIFMDAWNISAVTSKIEERKDFFKNIFSAYSSLMILIGSCVILFSRLFIKIYASASFQGAWEFIPFLTLAMIFQCFDSFYGTVYVVEKKSMNAMWTLLVGAVVNVILCLLLIPYFGPNGAAMGTFISYVVVFVIRVWDTKKYINFEINYWLISINTAILLAQTSLLLLHFSIYYNIILVLILAIINYKSAKKQVTLILGKFRKGR